MIDWFLLATIVFGVCGPLLVVGLSSGWDPFVVGNAAVAAFVAFTAGGYYRVRDVAVSRTSD